MASAFQTCLRIIRREATSSKDLAEKTGHTRQYIDKILKENQRAFNLFRVDGKWYALDKNSEAYHLFRLTRGLIQLLKLYPNLPSDESLNRVEDAMRDYLHWFENYREEKEFGSVSKPFE